MNKSNIWFQIYFVLRVSKDEKNKSVFTFQARKIVFKFHFLMFYQEK